MRLRPPFVSALRLGGFAIALAGLALAPSCDGQNSAAKSQVVPAAAIAPVVVDAETVQSTPSPKRIPVVGTLHAAEEAVISTRTAGILRRTFVDVGASVRPDDPLAQVDTVDYEVAVRQSQAAQAEVLARLGVNETPDASFDLTSVNSVRRAAAQLENARFSEQRLQNLIASGTGGVAELELNDAMTRMRVAESEYRLALDEAAALVASARERQALLQMTQQRLANTLTKTPPIPSTLGRESAHSWIVAERLVTEGQFLNVADDLFRLIISDPLRLRCKVPERYVAEVAVGQSLELDVVGVAHATRGKVLRINPTVDPASRTFEVEALIDNAGSALKPGVFAKGNLISEGGAPVVHVPAEAVLSSGGVARLFVVSDGVAKQRVVQLGVENSGRIEILSGVSDGERVVIKGAGSLTEGTAVQIRAGS